MEKNTAALLPCPFCGGTDIDPAEWSGNDGKSGPGCGTCGALADSAELWNRRAAPNIEYDREKLRTLVEWFRAGKLPEDILWNVQVTADVLRNALASHPAPQAAAEGVGDIQLRALAEENRQLTAKVNEWRDKHSESEESRMELLRLLNEETSGSTFMGEPVLPASPDVSAMVNRFLGWKLPQDFAPDCGISFKPLGHPNGWPVGTNLFTADQAKAMFEHCRAATERPAIPAQGQSELPPLPKPLKTTERGTPLYFVGQMLDYARAAQEQAASCPDVDKLANFIRSIDGNHTLGAGALAEKIAEYLSTAPAQKA